MDREKFATEVSSINEAHELIKVLQIVLERGKQLYYEDFLIPYCDSKSVTKFEKAIEELSEIT